MQTDSKSENKRVLIVDDDADMCEILQTIFTYEGIDVSLSDGCDNIIDVINDCHPHVVMLDYLLKGVNGGELCHQVKTSAKWGHIPVAIISAYPRVLQSLGTYGCNLFIEKPFDVDILLRQIKNLIHDHDRDTRLMKQPEPATKYRDYAR
jgi:DNA-binding NtrC family response regulator